jgi:hypothetical protein
MTRPFPLRAALAWIHRWWPTIAPLLGVLVILIAITPQPTRTITTLASELHGLEENAFGRYRWSAPTWRTALLPLWPWRDVVLVQRISAGPRPGVDDRAVRIERRDRATAPVVFTIAAGVPRRVMTLADWSGWSVDLQSSIGPISAPGDPRPLGVLLYHSSAYPLGAIGLPGSVAAVLLVVPPLLLLVARAWSFSWQGAGVAALLGAWLALAWYRHDAAAALFAARWWLPLLAWAALAGWALTRLRGRTPGHADWLVICAMALVLVPWGYALIGAGAGLGRHWARFGPLLWGLLAVPLVAYAVTLRHRSTPVVAAIAGGAVIVWGLINATFTIPERPSDFGSYYDAAVRFASGLPVYSAELTRDPFTSGYKYPLAFLFVAQPFAALRFDDATVVWRVINAVLAAGAAGIVLWHLPRTERVLAAGLSSMVWASFTPFHHSLRLGQVDGMLLMIVVAITVALGTRAQWIVAPLAVVLGFIKLYPAAFGAWLIGLRQWRAIAVAFGCAAGIWLAAVAVFGWSNERDFWQIAVPSFGAVNISLANQSMYLLARRIIDLPWGLSLDGSAERRIADVISIAALLALAVLFVRLARLAPERLLRERWLISSLLVCTILLVPRVSWDHYQTLLLVPLLMGVLRIARRPVDGSSLWLLASLALLGFGAYKNLIIGTIEDPLVLVAASYRAIGLVLLGAWWWREGWQLVGHTAVEDAASIPPQRSAR